MKKCEWINDQKKTFLFSTKEHMKYWFTHIHRKKNLFLTPMKVHCTCPMWQICRVICPKNSEWLGRGERERREIRKKERKSKQNQSLVHKAKTVEEQIKGLRIKRRKGIELDFFVVRLVLSFLCFSPPVSSYKSRISVTSLDVYHNKNAFVHFTIANVEEFLCPSVDFFAFSSPFLILATAILLYGPLPQCVLRMPEQASVPPPLIASRESYFLSFP